MDDSDVPAPGAWTSFQADEIIIYGVALGRRQVFAVKVRHGGTGYAKATASVAFNPPGAAADLVIDNNGVIKGVTITDPGDYDIDTIPQVTVSDSGGGADAELVPYLKNSAILNLEEGRWDISIEGVRDASGNGERRLPARFTIVAAYGYAFEGHCYRFDRPRLLGFEHEPDDEVTGPLGCGFDPPQALAAGQKWYKGWRIRSNKRLIELNASVARADELILDANRPGRRPPNTYASEMRLAHRGGRLTGSSG